MPAWPSRNILPHVLTMLNLIYNKSPLVQTYQWRSAGKWGPLCLLLRSFKVIGTDTDWSYSCDFLLMTIVTMDISHTISEIKGRFCKFFLPLWKYITPLLRGFPLEFCNASWAWRSQLLSIPYSEKSYLQLFWHSTSVLWTDRQKWYNNIMPCMLAHADIQQSAFSVFTVIIQHPRNTI